MTILRFLDAGVAKTLAQVGILGFIAIWVSPLIGGRLFWYRIGFTAVHHPHFFLTVCGIAALTYVFAGPQIS